MARKKIRNTSTFSLSFLDIMSCGLGAAVLIFLLLKHVVDAPVTMQDPQVMSEISLLEEEILAGEKDLVRIRNTMSDTSDESVIAQGLARRIQDDIDKLQAEIEEIQPESDNNVPGLKAKIARLARQKRALEAEIPAGNKAYEFTGDGERQYLTGVRLGGENVLILVDASASMLDESIVNVLRRRNMRDEFKLQAPKWNRTLAITQWIVANLPMTSDFQVLAFNDDVKPVFGDQVDNWYQVADRASVASAVQGMSTVVPEKGTNLHKVFEAAMAMRPKPDNIFLITDGLPTQGGDAPTSGSISGRDRLRVFNDAVGLLKGVSVNTFLLPMEGDPYAAAAFWRLAIRSRGSFVTPARDWP
ncbi:hypothetical protein GCM10008090_22070 [Arenicella chitinivorans]|uniref:VWA domain-containing protein n=1 Tax=Arenicella chitinivorans TaxID=1329800 RepID=A0A918VLW3_9GAMM|nr:VWA domain-containing protein [Arenicella chitinivorans]GHA11856.1 hypothetical protein GCM10008090_22070 [Arenicella chitinivorans]